MSKEDRDMQQELLEQLARLEDLADECERIRRNLGIHIRDHKEEMTKTEIRAMSKRADVLFDRECAARDEIAQLVGIRLGF